MKPPAIYTRAELADPEPLLPKPRPTDPRQLALAPKRSTVPKIEKAAPRVAPHLEKSIEQRIRLRLAREPDLVLWRHSASGDQRDEHGNHFRGGLPAGAPDLIGVLLMPVSREGRFFALETKSATGRATPRQLMFHNLIRKFGGFCAIVRSEDDAVAAIARARMGCTS